MSVLMLGMYLGQGKKHGQNHKLWYQMMYVIAPNDQDKLSFVDFEKLRKIKRKKKRIVQGCVWDSPSEATQTKPRAIP